MRNTYIRQNNVFLMFSAAACLSAGIISYVSDKGASVLFLNGHANSLLDSIFVAVTHSGLGISLFIASLFLSLRAMQYMLASITGLAITGLLTYILKQFVFTDAVRPIGYFTGLDLHCISSYDYSYINSFPSGHTMSTFAFASIVSAMSGNRLSQLLLFIYAAMVGVSRMYLLQHFIEDVAVGAFLGIICGHFAMWIWSVSHISWLGKPIYLLLPTVMHNPKRSLV